MRGPRVDSGFGIVKTGGGLGDDASDTERHARQHGESMQEIREESEAVRFEFHNMKCRLAAGITSHMGEKASMGKSGFFSVEECFFSGRLRDGKSSSYFI